MRRTLSTSLQQAARAMSAYFISTFTRAIFTLRYFNHARLQATSCATPCIPNAFRYDFLIRIPVDTSYTKRLGAIPCFPAASGI